MTTPEPPSISVRLRRVATLIWRHASPSSRIRLAVAGALITAASALTALGPVALQRAVDALTSRESTSFVVAGLLILYVLTQWLARTVGEIRGFVYAKAERRIARTLYEHVFGHIMRLPLRFHLDRRTGALNQTISNGLQGYQLFIHAVVFSVIPVATELATIVIVMSRLNQPVLLSLFCLALIAYAVAFSIASRRIVAAARDASQAQVKATSIVTDCVMNYETVKHFAAESIVDTAASRALAESESSWVRFYARFASNGVGVATVFALFLGATVLYAGHSVHLGQMTVGTFVLVNLYALQVARPIETLGYAMQNITQGMAYLEGLQDILGEQREEEDLGSASAQPVSDEKHQRGPAHLVFQHVSVAYDPARPVLEDISFVVPAGTTLAIVGTSGAGKSTLVRLLTRMVEPRAGCIFLDGCPLQTIALKELRRSIAIVPQDTVLFNDSIGYNIAFGRPDCSQQDIEQAATSAQIHELVSSLPARYETIVGERGLKLSGGERQRVSIARAAIKRPALYVFDEATSSLDSRTEQEILKSLRQLSSGVTTMIIAHRLSTVVDADRILVLDQGHIAESGTHRELLKQHGLYARLWNAQQRSSEVAHA